ncbi:MAG: archaemetzincin [Candidatus Sulfomarinibacteraceae bacterium]
MTGKDDEERETSPAAVPTATPDDVPMWAVDDGRDFDPLPTPAPGDWLDVHHEFGQSFAGFVRSGSNRPNETRSVLVLQPIGRFDHPSAPPIETLRRFTETYFGMTAQVLPAINLDHVDVTSRREPGLRRPQLLTGDLLDLLRRNLPEHAFCSIGITMEDLYPGPDWNYVFGQASLRDRVAVYSFVRYVPAFWGEDTDDPALVLRRSCKVLAHETAHAFGIRHCVDRLCVMNGSNHLEESDSRPLRLCPNDLRKLQWSVGFDVVERYRRLAALYREIGLDDEAMWIDRRLGHIEG